MDSLTVYQRRPRFIFSFGSAGVLSRYNPYHVLGLMPEDVDTLITLLASASNDEIAKEALRGRQAQIRSAYLELAAVYHPDSDKQAPTYYTWINTYDHFSAISAAYKTLYDLLHAVEYNVAAMNPEGSSHMEDFGASDKYERLLRELRHQKALIERHTMAAHLAACLEEQQQRQSKFGDGLFVLSAIYGDSRAIQSILTSCANGGHVNMSEIGTKYPNVLDVTDVLQGMVEITDRDATTEAAVVQLHVPAGSKTSLEGIWDPCDGNAKKLWVRYDFLGKLHEVCIDDEAPLKCPLKKHVVKAVKEPAARAVLGPRTNNKDGLASPSKGKSSITIQLGNTNDENPTITRVTVEAEDPANDLSFESPSKRGNMIKMRQRAVNFTVRSPVVSPLKPEPEMQETFTKIVDPVTGEMTIVKTKTPRKNQHHTVALAPSVRVPRIRGRTAQSSNPINITVNVQLAPQPGHPSHADAMRLLAKLKALEEEEESNRSILDRILRFFSSPSVLGAGLAIAALLGGYYYYSTVTKPTHRALTDASRDTRGLLVSSRAAVVSPQSSVTVQQLK